MLLGALSLMTLSLGSTTLPASVAPSRATVRELRLENGLQVVWEEDHRQPLVAIEARIKGGLRGEGASLGTGITHFIEHMLFKGTPTRPPGTIEREVRRYGGTINAFTSLDTTGVSLFVESRYLQEALDLLADVLQHAVFDQAEFDKERAVILSEIQMNLDDPDRRLQRLFWSRHFLEHPYRHPILGYPALLERLAASELAAFYASQYQPQNITIACVGDLDGARFPAIASAVFGSWPRGTPTPAQQVVPLEPPAASAKRATLEWPAQSAYVLLGFPSTRLADPAVYPLDVLAGVLGQGRSSRLYESLVRQRQLADEIQAWNYTPYDPGVLAVQFRTDPHKVDGALAAVLGMLEDVKSKGITEAELIKAKRTASAHYLFGLQTVEAKASDLADAMVATGDPLFSRRYVAGIEAVTRQDVQEAARRYCDPLRMTVAILRPPEEATVAPAPASPPQPLLMREVTLDNGATVILGVDRGLPIASLVIAWRGGVRVETPASQGVSNLLAHLLTKGTSRKTAPQIAQQVESLGGSLEPLSGRDGLGLTLQLLAPDVGEGLALLHELVSQSTFPEPELQLQRELVAKQLRAQQDEIFDVGGQLLRETLFGEHPYRLNPLGDEATIRTVTRAAVIAFAHRWMAPSNMVIVVIGDIEEAVVLRRLTASFGALPRATAAWPDRLAVEPPAGVREVTRTMDREQALILLGFRGSTHRADDRDAVNILTAVLSGMAGRLFQAIREDHGLSYTLGAVHAPGWDPGHLLVYAATRPDEQRTVLQLLEQQLGQVIEEGVTEEEVEQAKRYLIGISRVETQHLTGLARRIALDELYGLSFDAWRREESRINAVTAPMVHEAARRYLTMGERAQVVIVPNGRAPERQPSP